MQTSDRNTARQDADVVVLPVAAGATIFAGAIVCVNATGFAVKGQTDASLLYVGRAEGQVVNGGADGDEAITVRRGSAFKWNNSPGDAITQADFGKVCYIEDDETVARTDGTSTRSAAGVIVGVESDGIWVE